MEVAAGSASIDLNDKLRAYRRNGVQEYVVRRTREQRVDWFELVDGGTGACQSTWRIACGRRRTATVAAGSACAAATFVLEQKTSPCGDKAR